MSLPTKLRRSYFFVGGTSQTINMSGGNALLVLSAAETELTTASAGGKTLTRVLNFSSSYGRASAHFAVFPSALGNVTLNVSGGFHEYGAYVLENAGEVRLAKAGAGYNPLGAGTPIRLTLPNNPTGALCLSFTTSVDSWNETGTYIGYAGTSGTWTMLPGGLMVEDGRIARIHHMKASAGGYEEWYIDYSWGGFRTVAVSITGGELFDISGFGFSRLL